MSKIILKPLLLISIISLISLSDTLAENKVPEHYFNSPEYINPNPDFIPGEYAPVDSNEARSFYHLEKEQIIQELLEKKDVLSTMGIGEISFSAIKNESASVLGYFRQYLGTLRKDSAGSLSGQIVIDVNSLDTAVPGRNNRILALLFESMKPEKSVITVSLDQTDRDKDVIAKLEEGETHVLQMTGSVTMNQIQNPIETSINLTRKNGILHAKTNSPIEIYLSDYQFGSRIYDLIKSCNHKSMGNKISINAKLYFK